MFCIAELSGILVTSFVWHNDSQFDAVLAFLFLYFACCASNLTHEFVHDSLLKIIVKKIELLLPPFSVVNVSNVLRNF